jgi:hypothetical protein
MQSTFRQCRALLAWRRARNQRRAKGLLGIVG